MLPVSSDAPAVTVCPAAINARSESAVSATRVPRSSPHMPPGC